MKQLIALLIVILIILSGAPSPAGAADVNQGAELFQIHCAGCHANGGNIIRRGKTLKQKALKKYKVDSLEAIAALVTSGKNNMPAFQERLSAPQVQAVSAYVLEQAAQDWP
ncbi:cytochrome c6 PetJ [Trichocoleus sp. FACHB-262]|uniref:cytochrome c6 PetJ n=1 Tax=Trichocoleus sp. FACHB-262 TaxID=2692869 RepID=UPI0016888D0C|nr:c-type cytochrome [Trichocoleus sp. FACHB-262]MBD2122305.1 c-type cytochrome [Trichocoleus sp. FACHB-262]